MLKELKKLFKDERGEDLIEYALLGSLIAILLVTAITNLKDAIVAVFDDIAETLNPS